MDKPNPLSSDGRDYLAEFDQASEASRALLLEVGRHNNYLRTLLRDLRPHLPKDHPWLEAIDEQIAIAKTVPSAHPYGIPEAVKYLRERAAWLKREWQNGGDYAYLHLKQEECEYTADCIEDTHKRLTPKLESP